MMSDAAHAVSALSRITTAETLAAMSLVRHGKVLDLATEYHRRMPFASDTDGFFPMRIVRNMSAKDPKWGAEQAGTSFSNEVLITGMHFGTHFDAFCHVQYEGRIFGGALAAEAERDEGWIEHGIETVAPVVTRGVLLDVPALRGMERLPRDTVIGVADVQAALRAARTEIRSGDAVLLRTGAILDVPEVAPFEQAQAGLGTDAAIWLHEQGMALLCADNMAVEPWPVAEWRGNLHVEMLYHRGVHLVEWLNLEPLREAGVSTCCFICTPLKIRGATGSWVRPIALI